MVKYESDVKLYAKQIKRIVKRTRGQAQDSSSTQPVTQQRNTQDMGYNNKHAGQLPKRNAPSPRTI
jgi:hypothetical protein